MNPSILITPNAVEAGKLFSIIPTNGAGDLDVVRATSATRVDENGLIEIPATNLLLRSEEFNNGSWTKTQLTATANTEISPSGLMNADTLTGTTVGVKQVFQTNTLTASTNYTLSVYAKKGTNNFIQFLSAGTALGSSFYANFDLNSGVIGDYNNTIGLPTITDVGNGWYRCVATGTSVAVTSFGAAMSISLITSATSSRAESNSLTTSVFLWGAQLEQGSTATEYIPTTSVVRTRFAGITQDGSSASNIARLDYTNGSCPSILVEPQRTNLCLQSDMFASTSWTKNGSATVVANSVIAPDGTLTADTLQRTTVAGTVFQTTSLIGGVTYTCSIYLRADTNGTITYGTSSGAVFTAINVTTSWQRFTFTYTQPSSSGNGLAIFLQTSNTLTSVYAWGAQLEAGSNATSYIPTTTTTVTRNADVISKSGISDLIGQTEGTIYCEFYQSTRVDGIKSLLQVFTNTITDFISIQTVNNSNTAISISITSGGSNTVIAISGLNKICIVYSTSSSKIFFNGSLAFTLANVGLPPMSTISLGNRNSARQWEAGINELALWKTQLTDSEAIQLTTL